MNLITLLYNNKDHYMSGETLSQNLNITRAGIWKQIQNLKAQGVTIDSSQSLGYKLISTNHVLDKTLLNHLIPNLYVEIHETITSTNDYAKSMTQKPSLIIAKEQTHGKGRRGKHFFSPKNHGLYFSYMPEQTYTQEDMALLTVQVAVALQSSIEASLGVNTQIKWLNDLYIHDTKIAGILVEGSIELQTMTYEQVIIGIGINLNHTEVPEEIKHIYNSLNLNHYDLHSFLQLFINTFHNLPTTNIIETYKSKSMIIGRKVIHSENHKTYTAIDIDATGALILESDEQEQLRLTYGEVSLKVT